MREAWRRRTWIVDGHNTIFAVPALSRLQQSGERQEARRGLEAMLRPFAESLSDCLYIVYDGNRLARNPDARDSGRLRMLYSQPPEEADDRIVFLAQRERGRGRPVTVVTNDRRSLAPRLPAGTVTMSVEVFCDACLSSPPASAQERSAPPGDYGDIERHFLERASEMARLARHGATRRERAAAREWRSRIGRGPSGEERPPRRDPDEEEIVTAAEAWRREPPAPAPRRPPPIAPPPTPASLPAEEERRKAERKARGERRQRRRLEQLQRRRGRRAGG
jgi:predicted RNA-binding protein with PIN domain